MELQTVVWYTQGRLEEARSGALCVADFYEKLGLAGGAEMCRTLAQQIHQGLDNPVASGQPPLDCELL